MFKIFHQYLQTQQGEFPLTPLSSCCLLALITFPHLDNWSIAGLVVTANATTGLELILGGLIILLTLIILLSLMTEIALKSNSLFKTTQDLSDFIFGSATKTKVSKQKSQKIDTDSDSQNNEGFWSKYNSDFQNEFQEVRKIWLAGIDQKTNQIKNINLINLGYQNLKVFLEQHWLELTEEDQQQFTKSAQQILKITDLTRYTTANKNFGDIVKFFLAMSKLIGFKKVIAGVVDYSFNYSLKRQALPEQKNEIDSIFDFINHQTEYANTVLKLASDNVDYSPDAIKKRLIERYNNNKPKKQGLSWEEESKLLDIIIEDVERNLQKEYTLKEIAAFNRIQKRLEEE